MSERLTMIEAVAEMWADAHWDLEQFQHERANRPHGSTYRHCIAEAKDVIAKLEALGWVLTPALSPSCGNESMGEM